MPDLVHLVVEVNPQCRIRRLVDATKARSSRLLTHVCGHRRPGSALDDQAQC
ncbi:MAG: transposase [Mycobacterium sp.]|uniref:transposase n=1 Tax=Mycobacterium sp. TaxID=1785 RepID=UPI00389A625D